jgi:hypothetical protein
MRIEYLTQIKAGIRVADAENATLRVRSRFGSNQLRTLYFLNQAIIWFQASSAASLR